MKASASPSRPPARQRASAAPSRAWTEDIQDRDERHRLKRRAILDCAAELFHTHGYHETTLDDIATSLRVTKPTLYYYVRSKEDILFQILKVALDEASARFAECRRAANGLERLRLFVRHWVQDMTTPYGRCLLTMRATPLLPATRRRLNDEFRKLDGLVRELIAEGVADGSIRPCDVRLSTFALFGAINTVPFWFHEDGALTPLEAGDALFAVLERGLTSSPASREMAS